MPANPYGDVNKEFDLQRRRLAQQGQAQKQQVGDAMARRAAQLGGGPGGALIKAQQVAEGEVDQRTQQGNEAIDAAQRGEHRRIREVQEGRAWQAGEAEKQRLFARGEREAGQTWQSGESKLARDQQQSQFDKQFGLTETQYAHQRELDAKNLGLTRERLGMDKELMAHQMELDAKNLGLQRQQLAETIRQFGLTFAHQKEVDAFNMDLATKMFEEKDVMERLIGPYIPGGPDSIVGGQGGFFDIVTGGFTNPLGPVGVGISGGSSYGGIKW